MKFFTLFAGASGVFAPVSARFGAAFLLVCSSVVFAAVPETLTWRDLVNQPERWPESVRLKIDQNFQREGLLKAGTEVKVYSVNARQAELLAPAGFVFMTNPEDSDLLEAANARWASYTPDQRALTLRSLERDMTLWPGKATITVDQSFGGFVLKAGETHRLMRVENGHAVFWVPGKNGTYQVRASDTDVFARAREIAAIPQEQRPGRMIEVLDGLMVNADGKPVAMEPAEVYVQYLSASTCPRCAYFTPKFVEHYNQVLAGRDRVAFFGSATDATMPPYFAYVKASSMPWPTLPNESKHVLSALGLKGVIQIPGIVVFDKHGNVLLSTNRMTGTPIAAAENALAQLDERLKPAQLAIAE